MKTVKDVFPMDSHFCFCPVCDYIQIIQNLEFRYHINLKRIGIITHCHKCGNKLFIPKP